MHAFLKGGKLSAGPSSSTENPSTSSSNGPKESKKRPVPWVEKYRPKTVDDVVEQSEVVKVLKQCLGGADLPNLLLYGPPGTGKTSTILAAARQLFGDMFRDRVLELNASDDRGINVVRTKIKNFAQLTASAMRPDGKPCPPFKIVILDEADAMTNAAQAALRRTMESQSRTTRFCLICNYVSKIIEPITSRCTKFRFKPIKKEKVIERLQIISDNEKVQVNQEALKAVMQVSGGDMRRAITILQSCYRLKGSDHPITKEDIYEISGVVPEDYLQELISVTKSGDYAQLDKFAVKFQFDAYSVAQLFEQLNEFIVFHDGLSDTQKAAILEKLGESSFRLNAGGSEYIQLMDLGAQMIEAIQNQ